MKLATSAQMRDLDRDAMEKKKIPSLTLMERAAEGVCAAGLEMLENHTLGKPRVSVVCGCGNNGGDGIAAARLLFLAGVQIRTFLVGEYAHMTPDAREMTRRLSECGVGLELFDPTKEEQCRWIRTSALVVDALFGVGLSREIGPETLQAAAVTLINQTAGRVLAVDIASGVEADSGRIRGCAVRADRTVTFTLPKIGNYVDIGGNCAGEVQVHGIGIPGTLVKNLICRTQLLGDDFVRAGLPVRRPDGHKGMFGKLLVIGGSVGYTGAPYLTASAAERSGCGLVYLGVPERIWPVESEKCVGAMPFPLSDTKDGRLSFKALERVEERLESCDVLALGPGLGRSEQITRLVCALLKRTEKPVILDADGINALEGHVDVLDARAGRTTILTPHDGEFTRLTGCLTWENRVCYARDFAVQHGCTLVLKGHRTLIASPAGNVLVNTTGNSGMAKGGSGDVLTGMIAALVCQGATPVQAAGCGVFLHGRAGDLAAARYTEYGVTPKDLIDTLPEAFKSIRI